MWSWLRMVSLSLRCCWVPADCIGKVDETIESIEDQHVQEDRESPFINISADLS